MLQSHWLWRSQRGRMTEQQQVVAVVLGVFVVAPLLLQGLMTCKCIRRFRGLVGGLVVAGFLGYAGTGIVLLLSLQR